MERTTVTFDDETYQKLKIRSEKNGKIPIAQSIRELVDIGFRVEEAVEKNGSNDSENDLLKAIYDIKNLLINNLNWSLETRLLQRFLIENHPSLEKSKLTDVLTKYKEIAVHHVDSLTHEATK